ncbi:LTA synthase family protein [Fulvimonas sp. R45]|uniref:LTA synthase family protein n=1 Tax=Fulvimonas sp. R45 TaxID=3045937 RepID=UPI00265D959A|nr:LTA synthase family protein [Fulvimonas sp. R45]MDO1527640.1 LTA synthase family protein [Fulvimonas sp. R45]
MTLRHFGIVSARQGAVAAIAIGIMALASLTLVWWLDQALRVIPLEIGLLWRNAFPVFLLMLLVYGLSGRPLFTLVLTGGLVRLVYEVNAVKELNLNEPLMPGDLVLWRQVLHNMGFFAHYAGHRLVLLLLVLLAFVAVLWVVWRMERHWPRLRWAGRTAWAALSLIVLVFLFQGRYPWASAYADGSLPGFQLWDPIDSVQHVGFMAGLVRMSQGMRIVTPQGDEALVARFAARHADDLKSRMMRQVPAELPDIVVVQSEAFFDPGVMKGIDYGEFTPNFERLAATGITGSLTTPTYGGGTIRTEFETLTGYPIQAFPSVVYPYYGLAAAWMPSVPRRLAALGYSTVLFHPFRGSFWNRRQVMPELGFQHAYYLRSFAGAAHAGEFVSDHALFDHVLAHLDDAGRGPHYAMVITMENHGPWDSDPGTLANVLGAHPLPRGLSAAGTEELTYYLTHLVNGDDALKDFAERLLARPRWTVLLFYGDHLPALPHAFADLGFDDNGTNVTQHTRYLLVSNRPLTPRKLNLSAYELPALLFDTIGFPEDGYLSLDSVVRQVWAEDHYRHGADYGQIQFNAAQLEVACRHKLDAAGKCADSPD